MSQMRRRKIGNCLKAKPPRNAATRCSPLLIALPHGLNVSGVVMWAVRLVNALAQRGRQAGLILHAEPYGQAAVELPVDSRVRIFHAEDLSAPGDAGGTSWSSGACFDFYRSAVNLMSDEADAPVVFSPNLTGDCYGIGAALTISEPGRVRLIGWQHSDIDYDRRVLAHYEAVISRFIGVSERIRMGLDALLPRRAADVLHLPYGVPVARSLRRRGSIDGRALRLVYTGRMEHHQKRILGLIEMSDCLARRHAPHRLTLVGDGPAAEDVDRAIRDGDRKQRIRRYPALPPQQLTELLDLSDAFVLGSRFEGLSVSMLEGMARGCVPIVTRVRSGAEEAVEHGVCGLIADASPEADEADAGAALADAVGALLQVDAAQLARNARNRVKARFGLDRHAAAVDRLLRSAPDWAVRRWPLEASPLFSTIGGGGAGFGGTLPACAPEAMRRALRSLRGRPIVLHGVGRHTAALAPVIAEALAAVDAPRIVACTDDDRARHGGSFLGWRVLAPAEARTAGANHMLISSWLHHEAIWANRRSYEAQGMIVERLYQEDELPARPA